MAANFFLLDNAGYYTEFSSAFEVTQWAGEDGTVTIARDQDAVENPDHPSSMKIISTTDGKGGFFDVEDLLPEIGMLFGKLCQQLTRRGRRNLDRVGAGDVLAQGCGNQYLCHLSYSPYSNSSWSAWV